MSLAERCSRGGYAGFAIEWRRRLAYSELKEIQKVVATEERVPPGAYCFRRRAQG